MLLLISSTACAAPRQEQPPAPPPRMVATATAYCQSGITKSGEETRRGVIAADPRVLPLGSVVRIDTPDDRHDGVYEVLDTGGAIKGRIVDIYMRSCRMARQFGRRHVIVHILGRGWPGGAGTR